MAAVWPAELPQTLLLGWTLVPRDTVVRTTPGVGPGQTRRISTASVEDVDGSVILTEAQYATFRTFWRVTLSMAADVFDWVRPDDGTACVMRFRSPPIVPAIGAKKYRAQLALEILP